MSEVSIANATAGASEEVWMPIPGLENWYSVSSIGRVRREPRKVNCVGCNVTCERSGRYIQRNLFASWRQSTE